MNIKKRHTIIETGKKKLELLRSFIRHPVSAFDLYGSGDQDIESIGWTGYAIVVNSAGVSIQLTSIEEVGEPLIDHWHEEYRLDWSIHEDLHEEGPDQFFSLAKFIPEVYDKIASGQCALYLVERTHYNTIADDKKYIDEELSLREFMEEDAEFGRTLENRYIKGSNWQEIRKEENYDWLITVDSGLCWLWKETPILLMETGIELLHFTLYYDEHHLNKIITERKLKPIHP